jgi:hypothetical protein
LVITRPVLLPRVHVARQFPRSRRGAALAVALGIVLQGQAVARAQTASDDAGESTNGAAEKRASKLLEIGVDAALERARSSYQAGRYDDCVREYSELLAHQDELAEMPAASIEQARTYFAACLLASGSSSEADQQLRAALTANPLMASPDPVVFPDQVRDLFFKVKADFLDEIQRVQDEKMAAARLEAEKRAELVRQEQLRVARLESMVATETLVHQNYRWLASVPFGVGQFQNGDDVWGALFLGSEVLALGTAVFAVSSELGIHSQAKGGRNVGTAQSYNELLTQLRAAGVLGSAAFVFLATVGILEAHINFVPERPAGQRPRPLPPELRRKDTVKLTPTFATGEGSVHVGVSGSF